MRGRLLLSLFLTALAPGVCADTGFVPKGADLLDVPAPGAKVIAKLAARQAVEILARNGSWTRVQAKSASGWIKAIDLRLDAPKSARPVAVPARATRDSGIRGFSEEDLLAGSPGPQELDKLKRMGIPPKDAAAFARSTGLRARKQDYFEGVDFATLNLPDDFFDE